MPLDWLPDEAVGEGERVSRAKMLAIEKEPLCSAEDLLLGAEELLGVSLKVGFLSAEREEELRRGAEM